MHHLPLYIPESVKKMIEESQRHGQDLAKLERNFEAIKLSALAPLLEKYVKASVGSVPRFLFGNTVFSLRLEASDLWVRAIKTDFEREVVLEAMEYAYDTLGNEREWHQLKRLDSLLERRIYTLVSQIVYNKYTDWGVTMVLGIKNGYIIPQSQAPYWSFKPFDNPHVLSLINSHKIAVACELNVRMDASEQQEWVESDFYKKISGWICGLLPLEEERKCFFHNVITRLLSDAPPQFGMVLQGPSGCGKTTLLGALSNLFVDPNMVYHCSQRVCSNDERFQKATANFSRCRLVMMDNLVGTSLQVGQEKKTIIEDSDNFRSLLTNDLTLEAEDICGNLQRVNLSCLTIIATNLVPDLGLCEVALHRRLPFFRCAKAPPITYANDANVLSYIVRHCHGTFLRLMLDCLMSNPLNGEWRKPQASALFLTPTQTSVNVDETRMPTKRIAPTPSNSSS